MLYFIPSWYAKNEWKEIEQLWYKRRMQTEMDDTVKQIQLFQRNHICDFKILLLSFTPNLRHFLHRQGAFRAPYWSCFDAIQEIKRKKTAVLSFQNLNWPKNVEFIYSPFAIIAMVNNEKYAQIEFGEDGNLIQVDIYGNGQLKRKNIYDDRGFISCTSVYENGEKAYDQYLGENGIWKLCHFLDGRVQVNPQNCHYLIKTEEQEKRILFLKQTYDSMEDVLEEVFESYLEVTDGKDIFCVALHEQHMELLNRTIQERKTICSVFGERFSLNDTEALRRYTDDASCIVVDSVNQLQAIQNGTGRTSATVKVIPPYDTRVDIGISQQIPVQKILLAVDQLSEGTMKAVIDSLAAYLKKNENARVHLFTRNAEYNREDVLLKHVSDCLVEFGFPAEWARKENTNKFEVVLEEEELLPIRFAVEQCVDELSLSKCLREQRVVIDLAEEPDLFLQIACVSMGVPQILQKETQYMISGKNGRVNMEITELENDVRFYLESLANWNQALIYAYELGKKYTSKYLIKQWKEVIENIEQNTSITAGE